MARTASYSMDLFEEAIRDTIDKEQVTTKCKSLCRDMSVGQTWLNAYIKGRANEAYGVDGERKIVSFATFAVVRNK